MDHPMPIPRQELYKRLLRSFTRYKFCVNAELVLRSRRSWGTVRNISRGGMYLQIDNPPRLNAVFSLYLALDTPLELHCRVRRVVPGHGVGVSLTVPEKMRRRFEALLLALAAGSDGASTAVRLPPCAPRVMAKAAGSFAQ